MDISRQLDNYCSLLESAKITIRRQACVDFCDFLSLKHVIKYINECESADWWNRISSTIQSCLLKDNEKKLEDFRKRGVAVNPVMQSVDLFVIFIRIASKHNAQNLNFRQLLIFVIESLRDSSRGHLRHAFLRVLTDSFFVHSYIYNRFQSKDWQELYVALKSLHHKLCEPETIKCMVLVVKWGPLYSFPVTVYRQEFTFITHLCQTLILSPNRQIQEAVLDLVYEFCYHTAKDNRRACSKLGEQVLKHMIRLFVSSPNDDKVKLRLVEFFQLQLVIHNPKGARKNEGAAYAESWDMWQNHLCNIYNILCSEIDSNLQFESKKQTFVLLKSGVKELRNTFAFLFADISRQLFICDDAASDERPTKRARFDFGVVSIIEKIRETKSWHWIHLLQVIVECYPDLLTIADYLEFLKLLTSIQIESKDSNLLYHTHKALLTLKQHAPPHKSGSLWKTIADTSLRLMGSHNDEQLQMLLQEIISSKCITDNETLFQHYRVGAAFSVTEQNLKTLEVAFKTMTYLQLADDLKTETISWILSGDSKCFRDCYVAKALVCLVLKQWPGYVKTPTKLDRYFRDVEDLCIWTSLDELLDPRQQCERTVVEDSMCADQHLLKALIRLLIDLASKNSHDDLLNVTILYFNVIGYLMNFGVISANELDSFELYTLFESCIEETFNTLRIDTEERNKDRVTNFMELLNIFYGSDLSPVMSKLVRKLTPEQLLKGMFLVLGDDFEDNNSLFIVSLRKHIIAVLVKFSFLPGGGAPLEIQGNALKCLLETDYDFSSDSDYNLVLELLDTLQSNSFKNLSENTLLSIYALFRKTCEARYHCYKSIVKMLDLFVGIYPLVAASNSDTCKRHFTGILYHPFYLIRLNHGPGVSVRLLNCIGLLFEMDPDCIYSTWSGEKTILKISEFLTSDYQEVRLSAIENIAKFFKISTKSRCLNQYHLQEIMFAKIAVMSVQVLQIQVEGDVNNERINDETETRLSSILHTFATIMLSSHLWVEEALFTLLKISTEKHLDFNQVKKVVKVVATKLGYDSSCLFLEKYVGPLVNRWKIYDLEQFPFQVFNVNTKTEFFSRYLLSLSVTIVESYENISLIALHRDKNQLEIMNEICCKLLARCFAQEVANLSQLGKNKIYVFLSLHFGQTNLNQALKTRIEQVVLHLLEIVYDENDFRKYFEENMIFPKVEDVHLSVEEFINCLQFIETCLCKRLTSYPNKIYKILLQLKTEFETSLALEDKLRFLHLFFSFSLWCCERDVDCSPLQAFIVTDLTHTLLHHIKNYKNQAELGPFSCKLFKTMLKKVLLSATQVLKSLFVIIVSRLRYLALNKCIISNFCMDLLEFIIVDHKEIFAEEIKSLDSLPQTPSFRNVYTVFKETKYNNQTVSLECEIKQFLDFGRNIEDSEECQHSLINLKVLLASRKSELGIICQDLRITRSFAEQCTYSLLHQLICMLITLSCSTNQKVSVEAVKCLGEIGPVDLTTLILQPEKYNSKSTFTPFEMLLNCALPLLSKYIFGAEMSTVKAASDALFQILATKEARGLDLDDDYGFGVTNRTHLIPFSVNTTRKTSFNIAINVEKFVTAIQVDELWTPEHQNHRIWISDLVCAFLDTFSETTFFGIFTQVCRVKTEFCEQMFPLIVYIIISANIKSITGLIVRQISSFFNRHWDLTVNKKLSTSITTNRSSVRCMLNVVHFVRLQRTSMKRQIAHLDIDYLKVSKAAHFCTAHFMALLYAELWCREQINQLTDYVAISTCTYTKLDCVYDKLDETTCNTLQNILRQSYKAIGEVDALLGCGTRHLLDDGLRVEHYKEINRWDLVTLTYDCQMTNDKSTQLIESLKKENLHQASLLCSDALNVPNYESLWRLGQWNYKRLDKSETDNDYDKCKFYAFKAVFDGDEFSLKKSLNVGRKYLVLEFVDTSMESINFFYNNLAQLQCLNEIEDFVEATRSNKVFELLGHWKQKNEIIQNDYHFVEPIWAQRMVLLMEYIKNRQNCSDSLGEAIIDTILNYSEIARIEGRVDAAFRIVKSLRRFSSLSVNLAAKIACEEAQLCWNIQDVLTAKCILRQLCNNNTLNPRLHAKALKLMGTWMVVSSTESREIIIKDYFQKSIAMLSHGDLKSADDEKSILDTFHQLANFADREYQEVMTYIKSDIFQKKKENVERTKQSISTINVKKATRDVIKAVQIKQKQFTMDEIEIQHIETEKDRLLQLALRYYLWNLIGSDEHNDTIFRIISLLLENSNNQVINHILTNDVMSIPTYKFISILPQIIPHISSSSADLISQTLNKIVEQCAKDHPYHTLPLILALAFSNKDREYADSKAVINDARMQNAKLLLEKLKENPKLVSLIKRMEFLSEALIELAYNKSDQQARGSFSVPANAKIRKVKNFDDVLLPTHTLNVDKSCTYTKIIGISEFGKSYNLVGGINAPKRISCQGTDGSIRWQLLKGQDDLRQDAMMQQVFTIMNKLFRVKKSTRNLQIRTYKIVPLSMRSGIIQWVENTMLLGEYLTGDKQGEGAHVKYRPTDYSPEKCCSQFRTTIDKSNEEKLKNFNKICQRLQPVFHKFFESNFLLPSMWYEKRRAYILSVATSSMCGYILGIGDRHVNNILVDKRTAEVVHIDFGIAFEQGRVLPTPETVPFRLTRDIVDGMGVSGVEGIFRRSCEKTVKVLRSHYQTIITILEVLLYDPLYDWTVSTAEAIKRQKCDQADTISVCGEEANALGDVNVTAERALLRIKAKLQGMESGKLTTVEHQVGTLIQQGVDPFNLCRLFYGWKPYL